MNKFTNKGWSTTEYFEFSGIPRCRFPISINKWIIEHKEMYGANYPCKYKCDCCKKPWSQFKEDESKVNLIEVKEFLTNIVGEPYTANANKYICDKCLEQLLRIKKLERIIHK